MAKRSDNFNIGATGENNNAGNVATGPVATDNVIANAIDPVDARDTGTSDIDGSSSPAGGEPPRRRGRPKGSKNQSRQQTSSAQDLGAIQALLLSVHAAVATQVPEMAISDVEAKVLAENIIRVEQYYPKLSAALTGKVAAHIALISSIGAVYGPRFAAIGVRMKQQKENNVIDLRAQVVR